MESRFRKTRKRFENPNELRFITCSCQYRLPFFKNDEIKRVFVEQLAQTQQETPFDLLAWVLMPEHFHLLILPHLPEFPVPVVLKSLKSGVANRVLRRWREMNAPILESTRDRQGKYRFWLAGGGYDRNIYQPAEAVEKFEYIHHNPVERGLVKVATDWPWSSARWYAGLDIESVIKITPMPL